MLRNAFNRLVVVLTTPLYGKSTKAAADRQSTLPPDSQPGPASAQAWGNSISGRSNLSDEVRFLGHLIKGLSEEDFQELRKVQMTLSTAYEDPFGLLTERTLRDAAGQLSQIPGAMRLEAPTRLVSRINAHLRARQERVAKARVSERLRGEAAGVPTLRQRVPDPGSGPAVQRPAGPVASAAPVANAPRHMTVTEFCTEHADLFENGAWHRNHAEWANTQPMDYLAH